MLLRVTRQDYFVETRMADQLQLGDRLLFDYKYFLLVAVIDIYIYIYIYRHHLVCHLLARDDTQYICLVMFSNVA